MARVPLPFRGVAVLLLAASAVAGQTPEPPTELLSLDAFSSSSPDFLRQYSADPRHPLLALMVDGELTSFEADQAKDSAKPKLVPQPAPSASPKTKSSGGIIVDGCPGDECPCDMACPMAPNMLPYACSPPPCSCRKCQRKCSHNRRGHSCENPYLNWPSCPGLCFYGAPLEPCQGCHSRRCSHKRCRSCAADCGSWDGDSFCGCWMPSQSCGHKSHSRHNRCSRSSGCGYPCCADGWGMEDCFCDCWTPPPSCGHKSHRRHKCSNCYGCAGYACPGWGADDCMASCSKCGHRCGGHRSRRGHHGCQQPCFYPMMMPCMDAMPCVGSISGVGMMSDIGFDSFGSDGLALGDSEDGTMLSGIFN